MERVSLFQLSVVSSTFDAVVETLIEEAFDTDSRCRAVFTANVDHVVNLHRDSVLLDTYTKADYILPDGFPIKVAGQLLGRPVKARVTGADLFDALAGGIASRGGRLFMVGGVPGEEPRVIPLLERRFPGLHISMVSPCFDFDPMGADAKSVWARINCEKPNAVYVCLGFPKQELFIANGAFDVRAGVAVGMGAALDFALGRVRRAPSPIRRFGLEWLWRLVHEPRRLWRRYLVNDLSFFGLLLREWRLSRTDPPGRRRKDRE